MIPVDAQIWTEADVRRDGFSLETVLGEINNRGAGVKIALIDASRRNPFERRFRSFSAGLAPVIAPNGTLVMYSAALSSVDLRQWQRPQPVRAGVAQGNSRSRPDGRGDAQPHPRRRHPRLAQRAGAVDFVLAGRGLFVHSRHRRAPVRVRRSRRCRQPPARRTPAAAAIAAPGPAAAAAAEGRDSASRRQAGAEERKSPPIALADDPTIKSLTDKLADNPDDQNALYRRGQVYASKGAYRPRHQGFRRLDPAQPQGRRSPQQPLLGAHRDRRPAGGAEGLQRGASAAPELRRCAGQPRPRQPEERT